jgi:glycyl-tRNA synthetase beta chain
MEKTIDNNPSLLLEIGTEEIPARFLSGGMLKLKDAAEKTFSDFRIPCKSIKTYSTPRRIALLAELDDMQQAVEKEVWGPPVSAAFDNEGNPTKAAEAFAKSHNISVKDLLRKEKGKGIYIAAVVKEPAQPTENLLPELLPKIILSLNFPKSMRWGSGNIRFARPIHWIVALYHNKKVNFEIDGIKSSTATRGHRFLSPASFELKDIKTYANLLRNNFVIIDADERKRIISEESAKLASMINALMIQDDDLLNHVANLIEYPVAVMCDFPASYLSLPKELLITVMKGHQKYFALQDETGSLINHFIVVSNTKIDNAETVKNGAEKVIKARFEDARFYYEEDKQISLTDRLEKLKKVIYHEKLGTIYDKSMRIAAISAFIADKCMPRQKEAIHKASILCKTDLISGVVGEFPELQGIMGGYYAINDGYSKEIATAISEHYKPAFSGDTIPVSKIGAIVSLADKIDNLISFFGIGLMPTGTEDPFALRRQAIGIISILADKGLPVTIHELLKESLQLCGTNNKNDILNNLTAFLEQRMEQILASAGYPQDAVQSILSYSNVYPVHTLRERLDAVMRLKADDDYEPFLLAVKRINNIAPKSETSTLNPDLFTVEEERLLFTAEKAVGNEVESLTTKNKYYEAINALKTLKEPINNFFDKVLVMDKNEEIKNNRLSLIKDIQSIARQIADFSKLI